MQMIRLGPTHRVIMLPLADRAHGS